MSNPLDDLDTIDVLVDRYAVIEKVENLAEDTVQECIMIFENAYHEGRARLSTINSVEFDGDEYGRFYVLSDWLRSVNETEYCKLMQFLRRSYQRKVG